MVSEVRPDTKDLLGELYGPKYDILSTSSADRRLTDSDLHLLFNRNVSYANPLAPPSHKYKDKALRLVRDVYTRVAKKLDGYGIPLIRPPKQVAVVDAFDVQLSPTLIPTNDGGFLFTYLPDGHASAFYTNDENEALALSEIAIPGTEKNQSAKRLYRAGREIVDHILNRYSIPGTVRGGLRRTRDFYSSIINKLDSEYDLMKTATHEMYHHVLKVTGISEEVRGADNEGFVENATYEDLGEPATPLGTTYRMFMGRVANGFRKVRRGVKSAFDFIKNYRPGDGNELSSHTGLATAPA